MPVSELVTQVDAHELADWAGFEKVHGPLLLHDRIDAAFARLASTLAGGEGTAADFMPEWDAETARVAQSEDQMVAFMRGLQKRQQKGKP